MTTPRDPDRLIRAYLAEGQTELPDRAYNAVRNDIDGTRQRVVLVPWRTPRMNAYARLAMGAAAVVVVAVVGISLLPSLRGVGAVLTSSSPSSTPAPVPTAESPLPSEIPSGSYAIPWEHGVVHLTLPDGWTSGDDGTAITKGPVGEIALNNPTLAVHAVRRVITDTCPGGPGPTDDRLFQDVGPTVADLTTALMNQAGPTQRSGPEDVTVGGFPAKKFTMVLVNGACGGPEGRWLWENATGSHFGILAGGTATIYVVDVGGDRLVITSHERGASPEGIAQLDAIIASIEVEPLPDGLPVGAHSLTVSGVPFSITVPASGWGPLGDTTMTKALTGPDGGEAIVQWTLFPETVYGDPCGAVNSHLVGPSAADLAAAVSTAPGIELVSGPADVTVGGRAGQHVVVTIQPPVECDPGYFYPGRDVSKDPLWRYAWLGDTVNVWIVDVDGRRLFVSGETHGQPPSPTLEQEIQEIVDSVSFE